MSCLCCCVCGCCGFGSSGWVGRGIDVFKRCSELVSCYVSGKVGVRFGAERLVDMMEIVVVVVSSDCHGAEQGREELKRDPGGASRRRAARGRRDQEKAKLPLKDLDVKLISKTDEKWEGTFSWLLRLSS